MNFDDLLGILFLLFFIIGPALRGLFKPREPLVEVEIPEEIEEIERRLREAAEGKVRDTPPDTKAPRPTKQPQPAPRTTAPSARQAATPAAPPNQQSAEGHAAGSRSRRRIAEARQDAAGIAASERMAFAATHGRTTNRPSLPVHRRAIVQGMIWHEILSEPVSRRRGRRRIKKLIS